MEPIDRRTFLAAGAATAAALSATGDAVAASDGPVFLSTWRWGAEANVTGRTSLRRDQFVAGRHREGHQYSGENDPNVMTVGYGGLPNAEGVVELDAAIMNGTAPWCGVRLQPAHDQESHLRGAPGDGENPTHHDGR